MSEPRDPFPPYTPDSSIPGNTSAFEVPGGLYIKAESVVPTSDGLLLDDVLYPWSLWNVVPNTEVEKIEADIAALKLYLEDDVPLDAATKARLPELGIDFEEDEE